MTIDADPVASQSRLAPGVADVLDAALDAIVVMDERGCVVHWNPAAERTFGYVAAAAAGRPMAELIVPPALRDRHQRGFERLLAGGEPVLLGQLVETRALAADGRELPVELTVTRLAGAQGPLFVGYVRDITARVAAERELRASRQRLLEASDATRRELERDLHDGAQQRLIGTAIPLELLRKRLDGANTGEAAELIRLVDEARAELAAATAELRELARGIHPAVLTEGGLRPALRALTSRATVPVGVSGVPEQRLPAAVETTAYFVLAEGLANVARHSGAVRAAIALELRDGMLHVTLADDGCGGAAIGDDTGSGLAGLRDRATALDGRLWVDSPAGGGTRLQLEVPCTP